MCVLISVRKKNSFEIHVIISRYIRNVNLPLKKDFKFTELLTKTSLSFTLETVLKMAKEINWGDVESIYAKATKHASKKVAKAEINLNWLWTIELIMGCFDCIVISTNDLAWPIWYQYQCFHCFHDFFIAAPAPRVRKAWNLMGTSVWNGRRVFYLFGKTSYFIFYMFSYQ